MKKYLLFLSLFLASCGNSPVESKSPQSAPQSCKILEKSSGYEFNYWIIEFDNQKFIVVRSANGVAMQPLK